MNICSEGLLSPQISLVFPVECHNGTISREGGHNGRLGALHVGRKIQTRFVGLIAFAFRVHRSWRKINILCLIYVVFLTSRAQISEW